jgi:putative ABC transport system permease protein
MRPLHLRLFLRIINRNRDVFVLKIVTLSIAFACAIVITLFVFYEMDYDRFHRDSQSIFRVLQKNIHEDFSGNRYSNQIPEEVAHQLTTLSGDSLTISPVKIIDGLDVIVDDKVFHGQKLHAAAPSIASIFTFDLIDGSWDNFNIGQQDIVLSATTSRQYFGIDKSKGRVLSISTGDDTLRFTVAAVFNDFPDNSHEDFKGFVVFDSSTIHALNYDPSNSGVYGRVKLEEIGHYQKSVEKRMNSADLLYILQPIEQIYFGPRVRGEDAKHGDEYSIYILLSITSLILFLAISGYVNLTVITLPHRSKEIAIKKIAGTNQIDLLSVFAKESFIIAALSCLFGLIIVGLLRERLLSILSIDPLSLLKTIHVGSLVVIVVILMFFIFSPLLFTAKFTRASPNRLLSSDTISFPRFKRIIVFLQLGISIFLIVASLVMRRQVTYSLVKEPGQNHDQVVYLDYPRHLSVSLTALRTALKMNNANVVDVIATSQLPHRINSKELGNEFFFIKVDPEFKDFFRYKNDSKQLV